MKGCRFGIQCSLFILLLGLTGAVMAAPVSQILTDSGGDNDKVTAGDGNDVLVYTPSLNIGKTDFFDGGKGIDTLWLRMTQQEYDDPKFRADMILLHMQILQEGDQQSGVGEGAIYHFRSFNLNVRNIENVVIERINPRIKSEPVVLEYKPISIPNPDDESLV